MGEAGAAGLKSLMDHQQSANYCRQLPATLRGQQTQRLLPSKTYRGAILLT